MDEPFVAAMVAAYGRSSRDGSDRMRHHGGADMADMPTGPIEVMTANEWTGSISGDEAIDGGHGNSIHVRPTVNFARDGSMTGRAGCNSYRTHFELGDDGELNIGPVSTTRMVCEPAVMEFETRFLRALASVTNVEVRGENLMLWGDHIEIVLSPTPADGPSVRQSAATGDDELLGEWEIIDYRTPVSVRTPIPGTTPSITFGDGGSLSIETGCNRIVTSIIGNPGTDGTDKVEFSPPMQTLKACAEPEGVMDQETHLARALTSTTGLVIDDQRLTMIDDDGHAVIRARRAADE